jgi:hypothetical protein
MSWRSASAVALDDVETVVAPASTLMRALADVDAAHELIRVLAATGRKHVVIHDPEALRRQAEGLA